MQALVGYDSESDNDEAEEEMMQEMKQQTIDDEETRRVKQQKLDEVEGEATASATEQPVAISPPPPQQQPLMTSSSSYSTFPDESLANRLLRPLGGLESSLELPPEPDTLDCDIPGLQTKIAKWHALKVQQGMHFNHRLIKTRDFRNPSILTKLIEYLELDEYGSNFPVSVFDPKGFPEEAFYDQLAMVQQARFAQHAAGHVPPQFVSSGYHHEITSTTSTSNTAAAPAVGKPQTSIAAAIELAKLKAQQFSRTLAEQHSSSSSITSTSKKSNPTVSRWDDPLKAMQDLPASPSTSTSKRKREK